MPKAYRNEMSVRDIDIGLQDYFRVSVTCGPAVFRIVKGRGVEVAVGGISYIMQKIYDPSRDVGRWELRIDGQYECKAYQSQMDEFAHFEVIDHGLGGAVSGVTSYYGPTPLQPSPTAVLLLLGN